MSDVTDTVRTLRAAARAGCPVAFEPSVLDAMADGMERAERLVQEAEAVARVQDDVDRKLSELRRVLERVRDEREAAHALNLATAENRAQAARDRRACWRMVGAMALIFAATVAIWGATV